MSEEKSNGWGIASLVCGILGALLFLAPYFGLPLSIGTIVFACIQHKKGQTGCGQTGLILGIIGTALNVIVLLALIAAISLS